MVSAASAKGARAEREVVALLCDLFGVLARRRLALGRTADEGDIDGIVDLVVEVKSYVDIGRAVRDALAELPAEVANAGALYGVAFIRRPGGRYFVAMTPETFATLYREATA